MVNRTALFSILLLSLQLCLGQQQITLEDIFVKGTFAQESVYGINWMSNGRFYTTLQDNKVIKSDITQVLPDSVLVDGSVLGLSVPISEYQFNANERKILLQGDPQYIYRRSYSTKTFVYDLDANTIRPLSNDREMYPTFAPDGSKVAYVRNNNIFIADLQNEKEYQITFDGKKNAIINGATDWVYEEEFYVTKGFFWSPDGKYIAYYKFDETPIQEYTLQRWNEGALYPESYIYKYPKAGTDNSKVSVQVYHLETGQTKTIDISTETESYIPRLQWTSTKDILSIQRLNRKQNQLDLIHIDVTSGQSSIILTEHSQTYIDHNFCDDLTYLEDGKHLILSNEKSGFKHFYLYDMDGLLKHKITHGDWEVDQLVGLNEEKRILYYTSKENSPLSSTFYSIGFNGKNKKLCSQDSGTTSIQMSPDTQFYISYYSNSDTPLKVDLYRTKSHKKLRALKNNASLGQAAETYGLVPKEFIQITASDGQKLNAFLLKPRDFKPDQKYPVLIFQYSGPGSQNVTDSWGGSHFYWHQLLTQKGYIIACIDSRGTGGRGAHFKKMTYRQLGKYEATDLISGARHLGQLDFVDRERIGIWGWSYGGFVSSLSMFWGEGIFKSAIAVAPVASYRFYDTVYTERYMDIPQDNTRGYDENAPLSHVDKLEGNYLLIHGTGDDNVHVQNSIALQDALISAGKQFDSFFYPDRTHSMYERNAYPHLYQKMTDFILKKL